MREALYNIRGKRVWVAGHRGMVGSALVRRLSREPCTVLTSDRKDLDLSLQAETWRWIADAKPDLVFVAAAKVGGILANKNQPADFLYTNMMIEANVIHGSLLAGVEKLVFLGSTCVYPKYASQPIMEDSLLTGALEPTNEWYAIAKIAGIKLCQAYRAQYGVDFISAMPTNLYGPGDNFDLASSHVMPAIIRKAHEAKSQNLSEFTVWGTGTPKREFLHVDDCADAIVHLALHYSDYGHINVGSGNEVSIRSLAEVVSSIVEFSGQIVFDTTKPDGTPRKLACCESLSNLGWAPSIELHQGIKQTYKWFLENDISLGPS